MLKRYMCRSVRRSLLDYVTQRLSSARRAIIERHMAACPECSAVSQSLRQAVELADRARDAPLPASLSGWSDLLPQLQPYRAPSGGASSRSVPLVSVSMAAFALAAAALWLAFAPHWHRPSPVARRGGLPAPVAGHWSGSAASGAAAQRSGAPLDPDPRALADGSRQSVSTPPQRQAARPVVNAEVDPETASKREARTPRRPAPKLAMSEEPYLTRRARERHTVPALRSIVPADASQLRRAVLIQRANPAQKPEAVQAQSAPASLYSTPDSAYLNPDLETSIAPWTRRPADEIRRMEIALRQEIKGGDGFVTIPLPQIAGQGDAAMRAALAAHQKEAAIVDTRLVREIGLRVKALSFAEVCQYLTKETGIRFTANRRVADDKITIFCHRRSLRAIMRLVAQHFGFSWIRKGEEGAYEYEMTQTLRSQLLEEGMREKDQEEMLLAIDRSMERFRKYRGCTLDQINAQKATRENIAEIFQLQRGGLVPMNLYFALSRSEMETLRTGQPFTLDLAGTDAELLPHGVTQGIGRSFDATYDRERKLEAEDGSAALIPDRANHLTASLRLDRSKPGEFALKGNLSDGRTGLEPSLAVAKSPAFTVENAKANAKLAMDPDLQRTITMKPGPTCHFDSTPYPDTDSVYQNSGDKTTTADVLEKLFDATGLDVIGDYFSHLQDPGAVTVKDSRLFAALNQIGDRMLMRWTKTGARTDAWLQFRTGTFYYDRPQEIPNRLLERWKVLRKRQGVLSPEDLTEIGQLPDAQLDSIWMAQAAIAIFGLDEWQMGRIAQLRPHWRFLGKLSDAQRRDVWTEKGLSYGDLSTDLQNQFLALAYDGDEDRPGRHQIQGGSLRGLYAFATHPLQYGGSYAVLQSNPLLFVYSDSTAGAPNRMAIVGPWNGIYGMRPEMMKPDAFSILPGR